MIVIPMAGQSSRFSRAGYLKPKYQLEVLGRPLFDFCVLSFKYYFSTELFVFVVKELDEKVFVESRCTLLGVRNFSVVVLSKNTRGQAETVFLGLEKLNSLDESLLIFNIDTIRPNFRMPQIAKESDGYLEVFNGEGEGWSFVESDKETHLVVRTTEKIRISNLCSTGLYYFASKEVFMALFRGFSGLDVNELQGGEYYIAPMYNQLISDGLKITYSEIESSSVIFSGVPAEYEALLKDPIALVGM